MSSPIANVGLNLFKSNKDHINKLRILTELSAEIHSEIHTYIQLLTEIFCLFKIY